jgi:peptide/nickel transport system substrate-binding protein
MKAWGYLLLALTLISGILFSSCSSQSTSSPPAQTSTPAAAKTTAAPIGAATQSTQAAATPTATPRYGGVMKMIYSLSVINLGYIPDYSAQYDTWIAEADLESLLAIKPDGSYGPLLATAWTVAPDYSSITFTLRKGVKFHDGTDFNAQAVKYNIDLFNKGTQDTLRFISSVDVIDDYTARVNMSKSQSGFLLNFASRAGEMESPTALAANPKEYFLTHTVGTGPFQLDKFVRDSTVDYKKFPGYWQQGKPYLDGISWLTVADKTTGLMSFKAGEAQSYLYPAEKDRTDLAKAGYTVQKGSGPIFTLLMDGAHPDSPFNNLKVRQAVAYAVDKQSLVQGLGYGWWDAVNQFSYPANFSYNPDIVGYNYNAAKAKQLLTEAGFPNGFKTTIYGSGTTGYNELLQGWLKDVGIDATISLGTMANVAEWQQKGFTNGLQITPASGPGLFKDSRLGLAIFGSTSGSYPQIFHSKDMDDIIAQADKEMDTEKKVAMYKQLDKLMIDTYCVAVPLYLNPGTQAISPDVGYWNFQFPTGEKFAPQDAWLKK